MFQLFETFLYQPFLNLLIGMYWLLQQIPGVDIDMGVTVILFTVLIRVLLLPISVAAHRSEKERREISEKLKNIEREFKDQPERKRLETKNVFAKNRRVFFAEMTSLVIQVSISLILWMIFSKGLTGEDADLVYRFMPKIFPIPSEKLMFMGFSLWEPHWQLNLFQSLLIFILETLGSYLSPYPVSKQEVVRLQLTLPIISFIIFAFLPGGKKLFVITTLIFSIFLTLVFAIIKKAHEIQDRLDRKDAESSQPQEEKVVVEVKG